MNNAIEYLITDMLSEGHTLSDIVCEIARKHSLDEVYSAGALRFDVDDEGDIVCIGPNFIDAFVSPKEYVCLEDIHEKFTDYFNRSVYLDLKDKDYLIDSIKYRDMDQFKALSRYIWDYLKRRIECH